MYLFKKQYVQIPMTQTKKNKQKKTHKNQITGDGCTYCNKHANAKIWWIILCRIYDLIVTRCFIYYLRIPLTAMFALQTSL